MTTLVLVLFVLWWLVTVLQRFDLTRIDWLKKHDRFALFPVWIFFTPHPGTFDCKLLYRDRDDGGGLGSWREAPLGSPRNPWRALWNPGKRIRKSLQGTLAALVVAAQKQDLNTVSATIPYSTALRYVSTLDRPPASRQRQFMVLLGHGFVSDQNPKPIFLSHWHSL